MNQGSTESREYRGHRIELHAAERDPAAAAAAEVEPELLIDAEPVRYGRFPDGTYFLDDYAYDWQDDLMTLAERYVDYRIAISGGDP